MKAFFFFLFIASLMASKFFCEKSEFLPIGSIISAATDIKNVFSNAEEIAPAVMETAPKINLKIVPSKKLHITKSNMTFLLAELKQEITRQMNILADELEERERMKIRAASIASTNENAFSIPDIEEESIEDNQEEENQEDVAELINVLNEISDDENLKVTENRTYNIQIKDNNTSENSKNTEEPMSFRQKSFRNGPVSSH